jgi:hypothetical protein
VDALRAVTQALRNLPRRTDKHRPPN